jgi:hypothetical protein
MSKPDTSRAAVELRAQQHDGTSAIFPGRLRAWYRETADLLRALVDERDALQTKLRAASLDRLAANDAPLLDAEAAYRAGAEAMRRAAEDATDCGCAIRNTVIAIMMCDGERKARRLCGHGDACLALQAAAIRDLPTPKMEDKTND